MSSHNYEQLENCGAYGTVQASASSNVLVLNQKTVAPYHNTIILANIGLLLLASALLCGGFATPAIEEFNDTIDIFIGFFEMCVHEKSTTSCYSYYSVDSLPYSIQRRILKFKFIEALLQSRSSLMVACILVVLSFLFYLCAALCFDAARSPKYWIFELVASSLMLGCCIASAIGFSFLPFKEAFLKPGFSVYLMIGGASFTLVSLILSQFYMWRSWRRRY